MENKINLTFALESSSGLWNKIFEGFDQDTVLTSRFEGNSHKSINMLYRLGSILRKRYSKCVIEPREYGIIIKRSIDENDEHGVNEWMRLMESIKDEIISLDY